MTVIGLVIVIAFIVLSTSKLKWHPFLVLILAAFLTAFFYGMPLSKIADSVGTGFGSILGNIGLVIVFGTIIGLVMERTGAAVVMAESVIRVLGDRFPTLTMSIIGAIVSVPVFCDSGYVILNSLKESLAERLKVSSVAMSVALATGLYATHTFVPPTPGPIAAAGNLGLGDRLGLVILMGLVVSIVSILAGWLWAGRFIHEQPQAEEAIPVAEESASADRSRYGGMPSTPMAFMPIVLPIVLICIGSVAAFPSRPLGEGGAFVLFSFLGKPLCALLIGMFAAFLLIRGEEKSRHISTLIGQGLVLAAPILLITGAGGAFGAVIKETPVGAYLGATLSSLGMGVFMPFVVAAALKSAQGSSTVALVTTSTLVAPMLASIGLDSDMGRVLCVMAIGAGAMTVSHANDSFFWVVTQFSRMSVPQALRAQTAATAVQGVTGIIVVWLLSLILL
ncbi:MAG: GntP family permease [Lautropia sp.]|nr:GntP family permease [Lautropia sp.]